MSFRALCLTGALAASAFVYAQAERVFDIALTDGKVVRTDETLHVRQGDHVLLRWKTDRPLTVHLHGYELEAKLTPQSMTLMRFTANMPGVFPVHGSSHHPVLYVEVKR
jgi:hypothetical protein